MKRLVIVCILCSILYTSFSQNSQNHSSIDSIVRIIQKTDDCSISYDSSTFKNGYGSITCFYQHNRSQKLSRITEKTHFKSRNKKITRDYYFSNDILIKVDVEESSDSGKETNTYYYSAISNLQKDSNTKGALFYLNLAGVIQKSFYKKIR